jgi:uncharacterized protein (TIGR02588 family)
MSVRTDPTTSERRSGTSTASPEEVQSGRQPGNEKREEESSATPIWEWIVAGVGLVLVGGAISFLLYQTVRNGQSPPDITVRVESVAPTRSGYIVKITVANHGDSTAEGLVIEGDLRRGAEKVEVSHTTINYAPARSEKPGGLFFTQDPRQFALHVRALGYEEP